MHPQARAPPRCRAALQALDQPQPFFAAGARIAKERRRCSGQKFELAASSRIASTGAASAIARQALAQQPSEMLRVARRARQAPPRTAVAGASSCSRSSVKVAHAGMARGEEAFHLIEQPPRREQHAFGLAAPARATRAARQSAPAARRTRRGSGALPQRAVDLVEQRSAEAPRHAVARQPQQVADAANAELREQLRAPRERGPVTATGNASSRRRRRVRSQSAARAVGGFSDPRLETEARQSRAQPREEFPAPPKWRRLPSTSISQACGGSSETRGVNWPRPRRLSPRALPARLQAAHARATAPGAGAAESGARPRAWTGLLTRNGKRRRERQAPPLENVSPRGARRSLRAPAAAPQATIRRPPPAGGTAARNRGSPAPRRRAAATPA